MYFDGCPKHDLNLVKINEVFKDRDTIGLYGIHYRNENRYLRIDAGYIKQNLIDFLNSYPESTFGLCFVFKDFYDDIKPDLIAKKENVEREYGLI